MRILVTGAAGMLGTDVCAAAAAVGHDVAARSRAQLDITDREAVARAMAEARPDAVVNCAAYTNVDGAESDPAAADAVNGDGAANVAAAAADQGAWVVHVSTDYVFDGRAREPYVESDRVAPQSQYGRSKLEGELAVAEAAPAGHTIVRTAWLFGVAGPCFPDTIMRLAAERDALTVVADQIGCPTFTGHLAEALVRLADARVSGILHVASAGRCSWYEFAREIVAANGASCEVRPVSTAEFPRPAPRPAWSVLGTERGEAAPRLPHWRQGLQEYMSSKVTAT
jgi:dTDP-4-dehydrorhamnose reductase